MPEPEYTPTPDELAAWLTSHGQPAAWADDLAGLPWKYITPVVTIAANTGNRPIAALATAMAYSGDDAFKAAASAHIDAKTEKPAGNRAQRRAAAKRGRRG